MFSFVNGTSNMKAVLRFSTDPYGESQKNHVMNIISMYSSLRDLLDKV